MLIPSLDDCSVVTCYMMTMCPTIWAFALVLTESSTNPRRNPYRCLLVLYKVVVRPPSREKHARRRSNAIQCLMGCNAATQINVPFLPPILTSSPSASHQKKTTKTNVKTDPKPNAAAPLSAARENARAQHGQPSHERGPERSPPTITTTATATEPEQRQRPTGGGAFLLVPVAEVDAKGQALVAKG